METDEQAELSSANEAADDESAVWKWNGRDLNENLQIVSDVIIREAKPGGEKYVRFAGRRVTVACDSVLVKLL